jgi:hypothetical protein
MVDSVVIDTYYQRHRHPLQLNQDVIGGNIFASDSFRLQAIKLTDTCSFGYGGVKKEFVQKLHESPEDSSYFFEVATGYSIA